MSYMSHQIEFQKKLEEQTFDFSYISRAISAYIGDLFHKLYVEKRNDEIPKDAIDMMFIYESVEKLFENPEKLKILARDDVLNENPLDIEKSSLKNQNEALIIIDSIENEKSKQICILIYNAICSVEKNPEFPLDLKFTFTAIKKAFTFRNKEKERYFNDAITYKTDPWELWDTIEEQRQQIGGKEATSEGKVWHPGPSGSDSPRAKNAIRFFTTSCYIFSISMLILATSLIFHSYSQEKRIHEYDEHSTVLSNTSKPAALPDAKLEYDRAKFTQRRESVMYSPNSSKVELKEPLS